MPCPDRTACEQSESMTDDERISREATMEENIGSTLQDKKVAILVTDGFEQVELTDPRKVLQQDEQCPHPH